MVLKVVLMTLKVSFKGLKFTPKAPQMTPKLCKMVPKMAPERHTMGPKTSRMASNATTATPKSMQEKFDSQAGPTIKVSWLPFWNPLHTASESPGSALR